MTSCRSEIDLLQQAGARHRRRAVYPISQPDTDTDIVRLVGGAWGVVSVSRSEGR